MCGRGTPFGFIYQVAKLLCDCTMPKFCLMRRSLHRDRKNLSLVAFDVAFQKRDHVSGGAHQILNQSNERQRRSSFTRSQNSGHVHRALSLPNTPPY